VIVFILRVYTNDHTNSRLRGGIKRKSKKLTEERALEVRSWEIGGETEGLKR
jgi:hypothetical protein